MNNNKTIEPIDKTLVIGLGGSGKSVLVHLKKRLTEAGYRDTIDQPFVKLICLDFDPLKQEVTLRTNSGGAVFLQPGETCWLDASAVEQRINHLDEPTNCKLYEPWYPDMDGEFIRLSSHRTGAGQWRPLGRVGLFEHISRAHSVLRQAFNSLQEGDGLSRGRGASGQVKVFVVASAAGGTGSGLLIDVAHFLAGMSGNIHLVGMILLPGVYESYDVDGRLNANTYACLKELTAFTSNLEPFRATYPHGRRINNRTGYGTKAFDQIYLFDNILGSDWRTNSPAVLASLVAENIYIGIEGNLLGQARDSALTNKMTEGKMPDDSGVADKSVFATTGVMTMSFPPMADVDRFLGGHIALKAVPVLLSGWDAERRSLKIEPELADRFQEMNSLIDRLSRDTEKICGDWSDDFIYKAAKDMAAEVLKDQLDFDRINQRLNNWVDQLVEPGDNGEFTHIPRMLPDILPRIDDSRNQTRQGPLKEARSELRKKLTIMVDRKLTEAADSTRPDMNKEELYRFLATKVSLFKSEADEQKELLRAVLYRPQGAVEELKNDLKKLIRARPNKAVGHDVVAVRHWCRRFLRRMNSYYCDYARLIRINALLARTIERIVSERLADLGSIASLINRLHELTDLIDQSIKRITAPRTTFASPIHHPVADKAFWERLRAAAEPIVPRGGELMDLVSFTAASKDGRSDSDEDLAELLMHWGLERLRYMDKADRANLLELYNYVDRELLEREMTKARQDHILTNNHRNENMRSLALAVIPSFGPESGESENGSHYRHIKEQLGNPLTAAMAEVKAYNARELDPNEPPQMVINHLTWNRMAANLAAINHYYNAYVRLGSRRRLFHIDRRYEGFPELVFEHQIETHPTCGNPGCDYDITDLPRDQIICPECGMTIKSRCGNPDCQEDYLHEYPEMQGSNPDKLCPVCRKPARTYWWQCDYHRDYWRSAIHQYCPKCLHDLKSGKSDAIKTFQNVRTRDELKPYLLCPGCLKEGKKDPFQIKFQDVYYHVADHNIDRAWEVYYNDTAKGRCPKCSAQLLPVCPYSKPEDPHFVTRMGDYTDPTELKKMIEEATSDEKLAGNPGLADNRNHLVEELSRRGHGELFCTADQEHAQKCIAECSYCGLPLEDGADYCPRCKNHLIKQPDKDQRAVIDQTKASDFRDWYLGHQLVWLGVPPTEEASEPCVALPETESPNAGDRKSGQGKKTSDQKAGIDQGSIGDKKESAAEKSVAERKIRLSLDDKTKAVVEGIREELGDDSAD